MKYDAIIVGAGAAGLWACGTAAARGRNVLLLEKSTKLGVKILMSGGTRCNITHHCDNRGIAEAFGKQGRVLLGPLSKMGPSNVIDEFHRLDVHTKVEDTGKIFPTSNRAIDVRDALVRRIHESGATIQANCPVQDVRFDASHQVFRVSTETDEYEATHVLITTGGLSFPGCGTTGDGYAWLERFGHSVTSRRPALTPLLSHTDWLRNLSGLTLPDVQLQVRRTASRKSDVKLERSASRGGFLMTHFGCSGPTAMNVSRCVSDLENFQSVALEIDLLPDEPLHALEDSLLHTKSTNERRVNACDFLSKKIPKRLSTHLCQLANIGPDRSLAEINDKSLRILAQHLKYLSIPIHGTRGYAKAEVTAGGVALHEVDFASMQSKLQPGLFLAGEILDLDGPIGGFNFQAAWSTGHVAGLQL